MILLLSMSSIGVTGLASQVTYGVVLNRADFNDEDLGL